MVLDFGEDLVVDSVAAFDDDSPRGAEVLISTHCVLPFRTSTLRTLRCFVFLSRSFLRAELEQI